MKKPPELNYYGKLPISQCYHEAIATNLTAISCIPCRMAHMVIIEVYDLMESSSQNRCDVAGNVGFKIYKITLIFFKKKYLKR